MNDTLDFLKRMNEADRAVAERVADALPAIARAVDALAQRLDAGGRWFYVGAGSSGRLGALDAAEIPPTFGTNPDVVVAILAGGADAMLRSVEGAEDDAAAGQRDLAVRHLSSHDAVVAIAASGTTPYVVEALRFAKKTGALTISVVCAPGTVLTQIADIPILVDTGPEVLTGSTRMKAGTAQKLVLNMLSTGVMRRRGLVFRGEMVAVRPTNAKLKKRAVRIASELLGKSPDEAERLLVGADWELPVALVSASFGISSEDARRRLAGFGGNVAKALEERP